MDVVTPLPPMKFTDQDVPMCNVCYARTGATEEAIKDRVRERNFWQRYKGLGMPWDDLMDIYGDADTESEYDEYPEIPDEFIETVCTNTPDRVHSDPPHRGQARKCYYFHSRIRPWDGLASLACVPMEGPLVLESTRTNLGWNSALSLESQFFAFPS